MLTAGSEVFVKGAPDPLENLSIVRGWFEDLNEIIRPNSCRLGVEPGKKPRCYFGRNATALLPDYENRHPEVKPKTKFFPRFRQRGIGRGCLF